GALPDARRPLASRRAAGRPDAVLAPRLRLVRLWHAGRGPLPRRCRLASGRRHFRRAGHERGAAYPGGTCGMEEGVMTVATAMTAGNAPLDAPSHFRTLRLGTPFQPRLDALAKTNDWYNWAGYRAPHSLWDEELEYFAIRSQCALFDISPMTKYRIEGSDAETFCN